MADVMITRTDVVGTVSRTTRANLIEDFDADIAVTLAFNTYNVNPATGIAQPWGVRTDGGVVAWSANNAASIAFGNSFRTNIPAYTGRPSRRALNTAHSLLPYDELVGSAPAYAHAELLFLDHNYDWPVINTHLDWVANAVVVSILAQIGSTPGIACGQPVTLPAPPSQAELDEVGQLGYNNYQMYGTDPVNLSTGNFVTSEEVFSLTGVGDQAIDLTLAYNALDGRASPVGNGWNFAFASRVQRYDNGSVLATLADGRRVFFEPDGSGGFVSPPSARSSLVETPSGVTLTFADHTSLNFTISDDTGYGQLTQAIDRQGNALTLTYGPMAVDDEGNIIFAPLVSITDEAGQTVGVSSTAEGRITAFTHPDGRVWSLAYDASGNLTSITDGAGRSRAFSYDARGLLEVVTGADGVQEITNVYDEDNRVVTQTDGAGNVRTIAYSADHSTTLTDALGNVSVVDHNAQGQAIRSHDALGGVTLTSYDAYFEPVLSVDANGNNYTSTFDSMGRVLTSTNPLGDATLYTYSLVGDLTSVTTPDGNGGTATTSFLLNADGRAIETHLPDGTVTYATYNPHGDVTSLTDALGNATTYTYDARGNTVSVTDALGHITTSTYDLANRATSTTDANGDATTVVWDNADNIASITDALGGVTAFAYDANDSLLSRTDTLGRVTTYEYNVNLQVTAVNNPDGSRVTYAYDAEHHLVLQTNADGSTRSWEYDALGRATAMIDENGGRWSTEYDAIGNAIATVDPNGARSLTVYDPIGRPTQWTDALGNVSSATYNPLGLVTSTTDELGHSTAYHYDVMGRLVSTARPDATTTAFAYGANGAMTSATDARGFSTTSEYDALGRRTAVVDALGHRSATEYDAVGNVTATVNPLGARTEVAYDALNRAVTTTDALGGTTSRAYDAVGNVLGTTDALGRASSAAYDPMNRLASATAADGATSSFAYDQVGNLVTETNARGFSVGHEYDAMGHENARIDQAGARWLTQYDAVGNPVASVDPTGARTTVERDALGRPVATTDAAGNRSTTAYNAVGAVISATNPLGQTTSYGYDSMNQLTSVATPQGAITTYGYDANGNGTSVRNALGFTVQQQFDALNRQVKQTNPDGGVTASVYDVAGQLTSLTDPRGSTQTFVYDLLGRLTSSTDGEGFTTHNTYDAVGNLLTTTDPRGGTSGIQYDARNRVVLATDPMGFAMATAYDAMGNVVATTDQVGVVTRLAYDPRNLLTSTTENYVASQAPSASINVTTQVAYDVRGLSTSVTDPRGNASTYVRDALGRITSETDALGRTSSTVFDALGRVAAVTAPDGSMTRTTYTVDGYVAQVAYPDQTVSYAYDAVGNRTLMTDGLGVSSWVFDWAGRAVSEVDARGHVTTHAFDLAGNVASIAYPDGRTVARTYDRRGLTVSQTDTTSSGAGSVTAFTHDAAGQLVSVVRPSGVSEAVTRDADGRVVGIRYTGLGVTGNPLPSGAVNPSSGAPGNAWGHCKDNGNGHLNQQPAGCSADTLALAYAYDGRGLVTQRDVTTVSAGAATTTETVFAHDALARLIRSMTGGVVSTYGWDAASNLVTEQVSDDPTTSRTRDGYSSVRSVNAVNQLVTVVKDPVLDPPTKTTTTAYTYDLRGNRTAAVTTTQTSNTTHTESVSSFVFDGRDLLTSTSGPSGSASWVRDGAGRALTVKENGSTSTRLFDGFTVVAQGATQLNVGPDGAVLTEATTTMTVKGKTSTTSTKTVDVVTDVLGSTITTATGGVISADLALYGDFGDPITTPKTPTVSGFTGQIKTAGLLEFVSRTYDPASRVWASDDSYRGRATRASSMNRYAYVEGAPESFVDVYGFFRAAAAIRAQQLAAAEAAYQAAMAAAYQVAPGCAGYGCFATWQVQSQASRAQQMMSLTSTTPGYANFAMWQQNQVIAANYNDARSGVYPSYTPPAPKSLWNKFTSGVSSAAGWVVDRAVDLWDRGSTLVQYSLQTLWRRVTDPLQTVTDLFNGNIAAEDSMALLQIVGADAELYNQGDYCGTAGICLTSNWTPVAHDSNGVAQRQAITIGHTVTFPSGEQITVGWVEHEFTHVLQYEAMGAILFGIDYGVEQFWGVVVQHESKEDAYFNQSTEQLARAVAADPNFEPGKNPLGDWFETRG